MTPSDPTDPATGRLLALVAAIVAVIGVALVGAWLAIDRSATDDVSSAPQAASTTIAMVTATDAAETTSSSTAPPTTTSTTSTPTSGTGQFRGATAGGEVHGSGELHTYSVEVEDGSGVDPDQFASIVEYILADKRGWVGKGRSFQRVPSGGSFTITLATPETTDAICLPLDTAGKFSCHEGNRVVLNLRRWNEGTTDLPLSVDDYRAEVINHEVGHELGLGHVGCGGAGLKAPVMMQQSKGLEGCVANPWPMLDGT